jgi:hypothetical protein
MIKNTLPIGPRAAKAMPTCQGPCGEAPYPAAPGPCRSPARVTTRNPTAAARAGRPCAASRFAEGRCATIAGKRRAEVARMPRQMLCSSPARQLRPVWCGAPWTIADGPSACVRPSPPPPASHGDVALRARLSPRLRLGPPFQPLFRPLRVPQQYPGSESVPATGRPVEMAGIMPSCRRRAPSAEDGVCEASALPAQVIPGRCPRLVRGERRVGSRGTLPSGFHENNYGAC